MTDSTLRSSASIAEGSKKQRSVIVLGAGVIGLSVAYKLSFDPLNK